MHFFDQIKTGGFADPSTLQGAFLFAVNSRVMNWGEHPIASASVAGHVNGHE